VLPLYLDFAWSRPTISVAVVFAESYWTVAVFEGKSISTLLTPDPSRADLT
jgi:hypothetical protein